jgi:hypothetical protein
MTTVLVSAQETPPNLGIPPLSDYLTIKTNPDYPGPNQETVATLRFSQSDLDRAKISWFLNGEIQKSGIGEKTFNFRTGSIGTVSRVSVSIETLEREIVTKELEVRPTGIDLVWNSETYSPPFYKGRALPSQRSRIRVTAIPQIVDDRGVALNPKGLVYHWNENNTVLNNQSGIGKNVLILEGKLITRPRKITVAIESLDGNFKSSGSIVIDHHNPLIFIYRNHPLYGIMFNQTLSNVLLTEQEISLVAIPYFFSSITRNSEKIEYNWTQNGKPVNLPVQGSSITFGQESDVSLVGDFIIGVSVKNKEIPTQLGNRGVNLRLNER